MKSKKEKNLLILLIVVAVGAGAYFIFINRSSIPTAVKPSVENHLSSDKDINETLIAVQTLTTVKAKIGLDQFDSLPTDRLKNFHSELVSEPMGKNNPFAQ